MARERESFQESFRAPFGSSNGIDDGVWLLYCLQTSLTLSNHALEIRDRIERDVSFVWMQSTCIHKDQLRKDFGAGGRK